jgi:hypothetical protein
MSDNANAFVATVRFTVGGKRRKIAAVVLAVDEQDAIGAAFDAVRQLHPDANIIGGMLEPLPADAAEPIAREETPRPAGATVH